MTLPIQIIFCILKVCSASYYAHSKKFRHLSRIGFNYIRIEKLEKFIEERLEQTFLLRIFKGKNSWKQEKKSFNKNENKIIEESLSTSTNLLSNHHKWLLSQALVLNWSIQITALEIFDQQTKHTISKEKNKKNKTKIIGL